MSPPDVVATLIAPSHNYKPNGTGSCCWAFATALRRSELVALEVGDVEDHSGGLLIHRRKSKTDQEGIGHRIEVAYGERLDTCPVRAYRTWLADSGIVDGPIFRSVNRTATSPPPPSAIRAVAVAVLARDRHRWLLMIHAAASYRPDEHLFVTGRKNDSLWVAVTVS